MTGSVGREFISVLERDDFIRDSVWRRLDNRTEAPEVELVHQGHSILEYRFADGRRVFAKPFPDAERALATYEIQRALWEGGFGAGSAYRIPEPIAYLPEERVILMGAAPGECLRELAIGDWTTWEEALHGAARWLAAFHSSSHPLGPPDDSTRRALHLARRVAETAARRPDLERVLTRLLNELAARIPARRTTSHEVQTHGRYHPQHVYVASDCVTVIDTDRATRGDAAKDVGEFLHRLRADAMRAGLDGSADRACVVFVEEYARAGSADLSGLEFYWSYSVLFTLVARAGRPDAGDAHDRQRIEFYEAEFAAIPDRVARYGWTARDEP
jgi:aminoglycoside phosphotransferase (APT) family kinase protein